ncbi:MAG: SDR family NAD(P)-dependent oxidoreductase [Alphaproteobacteria bacterium]
MVDRLAGKVVVVTGAGSVAAGWGIGKATAVACAREGAKVVAADIDVTAAAETAAIVADEGGEALAAHVDVGEAASVTALAETAIARFGHVDVVHSNVGLGRVGGPLDTADEEWDRAHRANVTALLLAARAFLPGMRARRAGVFLTTSSVAGLRYVGFPHLAYSVTKAAAIHFTRMIAAQYAAEGIRAVSIVPGLMDTPRIRLTVARAFPDMPFDELRRQRDRQVPMGFMGDAWDVARAAVFLASDEARYITGTELVIDGGLSLTMNGG